MLDCVHDYAVCLISPAGIVLEWNAGAERMMGYTAAEMVGRHFACFYPADDRAAGVPAKVLGEARRLGSVEGEGWRLRADGGRFRAWTVINEVHDEDGVLVGFAHSIRDITERSVAQDALRESERQFRLLVNGVSDHAIYMLDPNGVVISWNAGAERIKGYAANDVIGQHYSRFFTDADRLAGLPTQALFSAMTEGRYETEGWRVRKDGTRFWASVVLHAVREDGELVGFAKITRDTTERRAAQLELVKTQERLFHAQKLEALGQLTGGVAHDFNNLLMIIAGQAEMLNRRAGQDPGVRRAAELIGNATARGAALTRQLLSFARRQPLKSAAIDLAARIGEFRDFLTKSLGPDIELALDLPSDLWPVDADANELELSLINLAVNARDAMPDGGSVTVTGENVTVSPGEIASELETSSGGEFVALTFADTGPGIPPDILAKVFDPFFTTKPHGKGTGLGLSQVYGFATQLGGSARVESTLGEGARVVLYLPRARTKPSGEILAADQSASVEGAVLVVDDDPEVCEATTSLVELLGYRARAVNSAEAALATLGGDEVFTLVLTDVVMSGSIDGLALAKRLKEVQPATPVLLVTGFANALSAARGEFSVLQKPFSLEELGRAIADVRFAHQLAASNPEIVQLSEARRTRQSEASL